MRRLLPRFTQDPADIIRDAVRATDQAHTIPDTTPNRTSPTAGGDPRALRGIPAIARGVSGTSPGTRPDTEAVHRADRRTPRPRIATPQSHGGGANAPYR